MKGDWGLSMDGIESGGIDKDRSFTRRARMKKYAKPSLKGLGLLRLVTKFSGDKQVCD
jgi:hypothetical protein